MTTDYDLEFEATLLQRIDAFLSSDPEFDDFRQFASLFADYYCRRTIEVTAPFEPAPNPRVVQDIVGGITKELTVAYETQLPSERREFFDFLNERASYTCGDEPDSRHRSYGYISLSEFLAQISARREDYQRRFGK